MHTDMYSKCKQPIARPVVQSGRPRKFAQDVIIPVYTPLEFRLRHRLF